MGVRTALIRINEREGDRYPVSLSVDDGEGGWAPELVSEGDAVPPDAPTVLGVPLTPEVSRRLVLERNEQSPDFRAVGEYLYRLLTSSAPGADWRELYRSADAGSSLRTLLDIRDRELGQMPWELISDPDYPLAAFADADRPWARVRNFRGEVEHVDEWWPLLRVMVVVGLEDAEASTELAGLHDGFAQVCGLVDLDVVRRPTERELWERYEALKPHILHFIGHGTPGKLEISPKTPDADGWTLEPPSIQALLKPRPRLVVMTACRSAELGAQTGIWDISNTLIGVGVPAVVAMQGDIRGDAAAAFGVELYRQLGSGTSVDVAVAAARVAIGAEPGISLQRRDPWLPSLTIAAPVEKILPRRYELEPERSQVLRNTPAFDVVHHFVDRGAQRRRLWRGIVEASDDARTPGIAVLGPAKVGKTAVAVWCVGACQLRGYHAAYVDLDRRRPDSLELLELIAREFCFESGDAQHVISAFDAYIARVDELHGDPPPVVNAEPRNGRYRRTHKDVQIDVMGEIYAAFRTAIRTIAVHRRVLLVLDRAPAVQDGHWGKFFVRHLLERLDDANAVCLITATDERELAHILGPRLARSFTTVPVPGFEDKEEFTHLLGQFMRAHRYRRRDFGDWIQKYVELLPPAPEYLEFALSVAERMNWQREDE